MKKSLTLLLPFAFAACASPARRDEPPVAPSAPTAAAASAPAADPAAAKNSSIEIEYHRSHNERRFVARSVDGAVTLRMLLDRDVLREGKLDPARYGELLGRVRDFVDQASRVPAAVDGTCRTPYVIRLKLADQSRTVRGCRTDANAATLGKLIHDAEFLLYRQ